MTNYERLLKQVLSLNGMAEKRVYQNSYGYWVSPSNGEEHEYYFEACNTEIEYLKQESE